MKILLINPLIRGSEPPRHPPFGLGVIANLLLKNGHDISIWDINAKRPNEKEIARRINEFDQYSCIGIGGLITTFSYIRELIRKIRENHPSLKIIVGGGVVSENASLLLNKNLADYAISGEGEFVMLNLINALENGNDVANVKGVYFKDVVGKIIKTPDQPLITNLDDSPFPAWDLFPMDVYLKNVAHASLLGLKTEMSIITTRGCPFSCNYCYHIFGAGCRARSIDKVVSEIKLCQDRFKFESLLILDETFTLNKKRVLEFCNRVNELRLNIPWSCYARVNLVDTEMLREMKKSGCYRIGYGIESGSQKILNRMNKGVVVEQARKAILETRKARIECGTTFMFGYPGEDNQTISETREFCKRSRCKPTFFFTTPYPGTKLYSEFKPAIINKFISEENYCNKLSDATQFLVNLTDFSDEELFSRKKHLEEELKTETVSDYLKIAYYHYRQFGLGSLIKSLKRRLTKPIKKRR